MNLIRKLDWFFKLEKRRYMIGILALSLVSVFNLIPPRVIGQVIDRIARQSLTTEELIYNLLLLILSAFIMYGLRYVWRLYIFGTANNLGRILRFRLFEHFTRMSPCFYYSLGDPHHHVSGLGLAADPDCYSSSALSILGDQLDWSEESREL